MTETCEVQYILWFLLKTNPKCFTRKLNCKAIFHYESGIDVCSPPPLPNIEVAKGYFFQKVVNKIIKERSPLNKVQNLINVGLQILRTKD